ncbi:MAG TPA: glucodextranase DOMON-like domain-containing protein [bacterium]|nr:glucodextranase DOMON-like domain-containing protein [bacterium]
MKYALLVCILLAVCPPACGYNLVLTDPAGDDHGPGTYVYPLDGVFTAGSFDITRFTASEVGSKVRFEVKIAGTITDPWGSGAGFSLQSMDIYIDKDGIYGSGSTAALDSRNVEFSPGSAWEYCLWCAPPFDDFHTHVVSAAGTSYYSGVVTSVDQANSLITVDVPKSIIGTPTSSWRYIVLMLSQSGYDSGRVRPVMKDAGQWVLGGGDDGSWDSNVIDLVAEAGVPQEALLANYDAATHVQAILINRVDAMPPAISHQAPASWEAHVPLPVDPVITDNVVVAASIFVRKPGGAYQEIKLERTSATAWQGAVPGSEIEEPALEYYIWASDGTNSATLPAPGAPFSVVVTPDVTPPTISGLAAEPRVFSPNGDGYRDVTVVTGSLSEPGDLWLEARDSTGTLVRRLADSLRVEAGFRATWDGKNQAGQTVPNGTYRIVGRCRDLAGLPSVPETTSVEVDTNQAVRRLDVVLLFHANQNLVPYGKVANRACYKGVLQTLLAHPTLKFMLHFSGTLLSDLAWFDPETLALVRQGIADGQFEIVGSTYAQNILYSTRMSDADFQMNRRQIAIHKRLIEEILGVTPTSFWNPERVWTQSIVKLLADAGYTNVQVEDHILAKSGITGSEYEVRTTTYQGATVNVFDDDKDFEGRINGAIDSGDTASVMAFLRGLYDQDQGDQYAVCYHEDMEATGLWDYESGENPQVDFGNLNKLLTALERDPRIKVTTYSEFLQSHQAAENVSPIVDGAAAWMGGDAWFAENNAAQAQTYREFFDGIRDTLNAVQATFGAFAPDTTAAAVLLDQAWLTLAAHQYEFAVHNFGGTVGTTQWELARDALVAARAARCALASAGGSGEHAEDVNGDGILEVVLRTDSDLFVFSPWGGKLLYWFDLEDGRELVGNENFMRSYGETYTNDNAYVAIARGSEAYPWLASNMIYPEIHQWTFEARRRCLNDSIWVNGTAKPDLVNTVLSYSADSNYVEFHYNLGQLQVAKRITVGEHTLRVEYAFASTASEVSSVDLEIENGLAPDCPGVMMTGRRGLKYWDGEDTSSVFDDSMRGVVNVASDKGLLFRFADLPSSLSGEEDVFGLELNPRWHIELPPYGSGAVTLGLDILSYSGVIPGDGTGTHPRLLISPNPSRGKVDVCLRGLVPAGTPVAIFDTSGKLVRTLAGTADNGRYSVSWDGRDGEGRAVASGVYLVKIGSGDRAATGKVAIIR